MTKQRKDSHSTEFGLWLRNQPELDSKKEGFIATNIDYMWRNYKTNEWMLIEEKRYKDSGSDVSQWQRQMFVIIDKACKNDPDYKGIHLVHFEKTSPDDGKVYLDRSPVNKEQLIKFLRFEDYK